MIPVPFIVSKEEEFLAAQDGATQRASEFCLGIRIFGDNWGLVFVVPRVCINIVVFKIEKCRAVKLLGSGFEDGDD